MIVYCREYDLPKLNAKNLKNETSDSITVQWSSVEFVASKGNDPGGYHHSDHASRLFPNDNQ